MIDGRIIEVLNGTRPLYEWSGREFVPAMVDGGGADTGGPNALPHGKSVWRPGTSGQPSSPATLSFSPIKRPPGKPWDNVYEFGVISRTPPPIVFVEWELEFCPCPTQQDLPGNAREFEVELCESGWTYNCAWQYKWSRVDGPPAWRLFDQIASRWVAVPTLPTPAPVVGQFVSVRAYFAIDRVLGVTYHDSISIDGKSYAINMSHPKRKKWSDSTNYLHNAVQIDSMGDGVSCAVQIRNWTVRGL